MAKKENLIITFNNDKRYAKFEMPEKTAQVFKKDDVWDYWQQGMFLLKKTG